jgi:hypothetical protein
MNQEIFDERVKRLHEVNGVIAKLEVSIQGAAFELLKPYVVGGFVTTGEAMSTHDDDRSAGTSSLETFLQKHADQDGKPAENVFMISAYFYTRYGTEAFSVEDIRTTADEAGLTVPGRIDMTLKGAARDGKSLYISTSNGFRPTVYGESFLKATYGVTKGREKRMPADQS